MDTQWVRLAPRRWLRRLRLAYLWRRQGRPRDRMVIVRRGTIDGGIVSGWELDGRYCKAPGVAGITLLRDGSVVVGGYSIAELGAVRV